MNIHRRTAIIPALDEEESIGSVISAIPSGSVDRVIVVDGGSRDSTVTVARKNGAEVVREPRRGYGRACAAGASAAGDGILVFLDGDGADDPVQVPAFVSPLEADDADMVLGSRIRGGVAAGALPWHQVLGNRIAARLINNLYGLSITDLGPFRSIRRETLLDLGVAGMTYGWPTEMIVKAAGRLRIREIPVRCRPRIGGRSKIGGTVKGSLFASWHIIHTIFRHAGERGH